MDFENDAWYFKLDVYPQIFVFEVDWRPLAVWNGIIHSMSIGQELTRLCTLQFAF